MQKKKDPNHNDWYFPKHNVTKSRIKLETWLLNKQVDDLYNCIHGTSFKRKYIDIDDDTIKFLDKFKIEEEKE